MMTKEAFIDFILEGSQKTADRAPAPQDSALPEGFDGFDTEAAPPRPQPEIGSFARRLLEASGFELAKLVETRALLRSSDAVVKFLPERAAYWPKTEARPFHTILFEAAYTHKDLLSIPAFRSHVIEHLDIAEDALARLVDEALEGFQRRGSAVTAETLLGNADETLCVVSILDARDPTQSPAPRLVCFGTHNKATGGLETFQITEAVRSWERQLAHAHLALLHERQFKKLATAEWQEAFTTTDERKQATRLLDVCTGKSPKEPEIQEAVIELLDTIAKSFGLRKRDKGRRLQAFTLPADHDIGIDPEEREGKFGGKNPFSGVTLRDEESRLLGYIVYPLRTPKDAERLRAHLAEHNRFHNVLVVYPHAQEATLELWQGQDQLTGKLRKGHGPTGAAGVVNLLSRFFVVSKAKVKDPTDLALELASRARYLHRLALRQLSAERAGTSLHQLFAAFSDVLLHDQTEDAFADAYAQTLTYGLLAARWLSKEDQKAQRLHFTRSLAAKYLPATSPFLRDFFRDVLQAGFEPKLTWLLDDIAALLDRIDVDSVFRKAFNLQDSLSTDPIIHFYEPFLAAYDADQRRDRGVYYTPDAIVRYMIASADALVAAAVPTSGGLATGVVRVIDPATGTGTFLKELVRYCASRATDDAARERMVANMCGFEITVAPYAICHLRLALALRKLLGEHATIPPVRVHLADTLDPAIDPPPSLFKESAALAREALAAKDVKAERRWTLVVGNPPYKNNSDYTLAQIAERFPSLLKTSRDAAAAQVRNIRDDYAWFFAAADSFVSGGGAICFVTSDSYLKKSSYRHFRQELARKYRILRITRLGSGIFANVGPRIGFAVILMLRREQPVTSSSTPEPVEVVDISGLAADTLARDLGSPEDPRLQWLAAVSNTVDSGMNSPSLRRYAVTPSEQNEFRFVAEADLTVQRPAPLQIVSKAGGAFSSIFFNGPLCCRAPMWRSFESLLDVRKQFPALLP